VSGPRSCGRKFVRAGQNLEQVGRSREGSVRLHVLNTLYAGDADDCDRRGIRR
jgi:hypothetical protein